MLARCYAAEGQYAEALVTLNAVPTPPLPRDERELLMVVPPPEPEKITVPQVGHAHTLTLKMQMEQQTPLVQRPVHEDQPGHQQR